MNVNIRKLHADAVVPSYATSGAAGFDLVAVEDVIIAPGDTVKVPLGLAFEIPEGYVMIVAMRSGVALNTYLRQPNGIGVIDSDYRGEVAMLFDNTAPLTSMWDHPLLITDAQLVDENAEKYEHRAGTYVIRKGDRVAQAFILPFPRVEFTVVDELSETRRGAGGFGSTGTNMEVSEWKA